MARKLTEKPNKFEDVEILVEEGDWRESPTIILYEKSGKKKEIYRLSLAEAAEINGKLSKAIASLIRGKDGGVMRVEPQP